MTDSKRPLSGFLIGLSISNSEDSSDFGFPPLEINRTVLRIVAALSGQGAGISFGHDWRDDGVMAAVHAYMERSRPINQGKEVPILLNIIPWPDKLRLTKPERERLKFSLKVEQAGLPTSLKSYRKNPKSEISEGYLRARALTHLRQKLTAVSNARICIGGQD